MGNDVECQAITDLIEHNCHVGWESLKDLLISYPKSRFATKLQCKRCNQVCYTRHNGLKENSLISELYDTVKILELR